MNINCKTIPVFLLLLGFTFKMQSQTLYFNEVVSSNSIYQDEYGDYPDWFELYNASSSAISLLNWTCSDDLEEPAKWAFPDISIAPDTYLQVWASAKDKDVSQSFRTLVNQGDEFRYLLPNEMVPNEWLDLNFDDSVWLEGLSGFGYGDGDDNTFIPAGTSSIFLRKTFTVTDVDNIESLILDLDYDDGFVAYINGVEIARANITGLYPAYNAPTLTDREAQMYLGGLPERFTASNIAGLLQEGENILCVQAHNISSTSSDFTIIPFLSAVYSSPSNDGISPPAILSLNDISAYHTNFKLSSGGESLYLFDSDGDFVDSLVLPALPANIAVGYSAAQYGDLKYFDQLSPAAVNPGPGYLGISDGTIEFSHPGGLTGPLSLTLSGVDANSTIHYTLDATLPTEASPVYNGAIAISDNTVIRARVFKEDFLPAQAQTRSYILNASHELPVLLLTADPFDFFDEETGIYMFGNSYQPAYPFFGANFWEDQERPIHFALYQEDGALEADYDAGAKIFGGWSRAQDQRSLSLFARNQYGFNEFDNAFFEDRPHDTYQALVLRNSGNDWGRTMMRDAVLTGLMKGADLECQAYRPMVTYFNGEYWGIYNMREKVNEHFLSAKWGVGPDEIDLLEADGSAIHGSNEDYLNLLDFIGSADLSIPANYDLVSSQIDLENYALYQAAQIYFGNTDWPGNNIKYARPHGGKWRWILYDTDFGFGTWDEGDFVHNTLGFALEPNGPVWPNPSWATFLFRQLTETIPFRNMFVNRLADEMNSRFLLERVSEHIDSLAGRIESEVPDHFGRWGVFPPGGWLNLVNWMKNFGEMRQPYLKQYVLDEFDLSAYHELNIEITDLSEGWVQVNSLKIEENNWEGDYFQGVPILVTANAKPGYIFSHWEGDIINSTEASLSIDMFSTMNLRPVFEVNAGAVIVINEINYNSVDAADTGDWIELYNSSSSDFDLSGWIMKDDDDTHSFSIPQGTIIEGDGYLILTRDQESFDSVFPNSGSLAGDFDFGLSRNGDAVRLYDADSVLVDEVYYLPDAPWPTLADGQGYTLELISPDLDNSLAESWISNNLYGSPHRENTLVNTNNLAEDEFRIVTYPNPFSAQINLGLNMKADATILINLFNHNGQLAEQIKQTHLSAGYHLVTADLSHLPAGVYHAKVMVDGFAPVTLKWIKL